MGETSTTTTDVTGVSPQESERETLGGTCSPNNPREGGTKEPGQGTESVLGVLRQDSDNVLTKRTIQYLKPFVPGAGSS